MDKKIPTSIGTIILVIIAVTVFMFVWIYEKNQYTDEQIPYQSFQSKVVATKDASLEESVKIGLENEFTGQRISNVTASFIDGDHAFGTFTYQDSGQYVHEDQVWFASKTDSIWKINNVSFAGYFGLCEVFAKNGFSSAMTPDCWDQERKVLIETTAPQNFYLHGFTKTDKARLIKAFLVYMKASMPNYVETYSNKTLFVRVNQNTSNYLRGTILIGGQENISAPNFYAVKEKNIWKVLFNGQDWPNCANVDSYHFPQQILQNCYDDQAKKERTPL
jgi:hypothetical protein